MDVIDGIGLRQIGYLLCEFNCLLEGIVADQSADAKNQGKDQKIDAGESPSAMAAMRELAVDEIHDRQKHVGDDDRQYDEEDGVTQAVHQIAEDQSPDYAKHTRIEPEHGVSFRT